VIAPPLSSVKNRTLEHLLPEAPAQRGGADFASNAAIIQGGHGRGPGRAVTEKRLSKLAVNLLTAGSGLPPVPDWAARPAAMAGRR
jgi:hypothetical protein